MRRKTIYTLIFLLSLLATSCHNEYYERIRDYDERIAALQETCDMMNSNLSAIRILVSSIQTKDMISGITAIFSEDNKELGYKINFIKHDPITIYHGQSGQVPLIGSKKDSDGNYYWTIQYPGGSTQWILGANGEKFLSMGVVPYIRSRGDRWQISYDNLKTWVDLGQATGEDGDAMFKSFDTSNPDFVIITLANGTVFKIPTFKAYEQVKTDIATSTSNILAQETIVEAILDGTIYIKSTSPVISDGDTLGTRVLLSNGRSFTIKNWVKSDIPKIFAKEDPTNHKLYWAIQYNDKQPKWILDEDGAKILVNGSTVKPPIIDIAADEDGYYYWTIKYGDGKVSFVEDAYGNRPHATDSAYFSVFREVDTTNPDYLVVTVADYSKYYLPKEYTVEIPSNVVARAGEDVEISYKIYGELSEETKISFFCTGGVNAVVSGAGKITIEAPDAFTMGNGSVLVFFEVHKGLTIVKSVNVIELL